MDRDQIYELLEKQNWERISLALTRYALWKINRLSWRRGKLRLPGGHTPESIAQQAIAKLFDPDGRNWDPEKHPDPLEYLKGVVDSDVSHLVESVDHKGTVNYEEGYEDEEESVDLAVKKAVTKRITQESDTPLDALLQKEEKEREEKVLSAFIDFISEHENLLGVWECLQEGITKPADMATRLKKDVEEIYQLKRKLSRRVDAFTKELARK